ncbi:UTRA domain-containing protein [Paracoccus caeni]|uniref:UTRA domain-containing protein n=1 Tax=Paracoccus caeni TaxID=657651 RepID=A0A934SCL3_9RHOB|nr:GntR family transcriptional regulator [Paracoccus caeni]MBK4216395.1 UTRA domain-containing protein [Paracoccus caeni]
MTNISGSFARSLRPSHRSGVSKRVNTWQSVRTEVLSRIRAREWQPGELIPTEEQLSAQLGCARATVNRALRELADSGIIERRRKVGTRVTASASRRTTLEMPVIRDEIEAMGAEYAYQMISYEERQASDIARHALQVDSGERLILVRSQYLANGTPHCCETIWLHPKLLPWMAQNTFRELPAHEWLAAQVPLTHTRYAIVAEGATGLCAKNLGVAEHTPVLTIERTNWIDASPVSFARQFYRPQHRLVSEE